MEGQREHLKPDGPTKGVVAGQRPRAYCELLTGSPSRDGRGDMEHLVGAVEEAKPTDKVIFGTPLGYGNEDPGLCTRRDKSVRQQPN